MSQTNCILFYDVAVATKRERCVLYFNFLSGLGLGLGALIGGYLYRHLPPLLGSSFFSLLLISGPARLLIAVIMRYTVKEVRHAEHVRLRVLLYGVSGMRAIGLFSRELLFVGKRFRRKK